MGKEMGVQKIEMYCKMIEEQFDPIESTLKVHQDRVRKEVEVDALKELGIYELHMRCAQLRLELQEQERQLASWTTTTRDEKTGVYKSAVQRAVDEKMKGRLNGIPQQVHKVKQDLLFRIKLAGVAEDVKNVFEDLSKAVAGLSDQVTEKMAQLPGPRSGVEALDV